MFFIRRSKIIVDCFTHAPTAYDLFPISKATDYYPDWWKNTPSNYVIHDFLKKPTIKSCSGFIDYYTSGFTIPLWTEIDFDISQDMYKWFTADGETKIETHSLAEMGQYINPDEYGHIKINTPWAIKTKSDINWMFTNMYWNHKPIEDFVIPPGIVNYKYQHTTHINMFLSLKEKKTFSLNAGDPMVYLLPLTEKEVILKHHLIDMNEFNNYFRTKISFLNSYRKRANILKSKSKCPFGFGS